MPHRPAAVLLHRTPSPSPIATALLVGLSLVACASPQRPPPEVSPSASREAPPPEATPEPSCALGDPSAALPEDASSAGLIEQLGSGLDNYERTAGVWLPEAPILVNEAFDFGVAMGMPDVGPGVAAGKRKQANEKKAARLADVQLAPALAERLATLRGCGVHAYGLLWGEAADASLRVVVDQFVVAAGAHTLQRSEAAEAGHRPLEGEDAWTAASLGEAFESGLKGALDQLAPPDSLAPQPD